MNRKSEAKEIITTLQRGGYAICPCCGERIRLGDAGLFYLSDFTPEALELYQEQIASVDENRRDIAKRRREVSTKSQVGATAVNIGFILERLAPALNGFSFDRNDCRALFDPIDYVIFEGLSNSGHVNKILFVDIKTGQAKLSNRQRQIRQTVVDRRVEWSTYLRNTTLGE